MRRLLDGFMRARRQCYVPTASQTSHLCSSPPIGRRSPRMMPHVMPHMALEHGLRARPWVHVTGAAAAGDDVRYAFLDGAVLAIPIGIALSELDHRTPGRIAESV